MKKILSIAAALSMVFTSSSLAFSAVAENADLKISPDGAKTGDVNCDGIVDTLDVIALAAYLKDIRPLASEGLKNADVNGDGKVNSGDVTVLASGVKGSKTDLITDHNVIRQMLIDFIKENKIPATVGEGSLVDGNNILISYEWTNDDVEDKINAFVQEKNIDPSMIIYDILD